MSTIPRWIRAGQGRQARIEDAGTLYPKRMETVDERNPRLLAGVHREGQADNKPFLLWLNPTRMHIARTCRRSTGAANSKNGWTIHEAGMAQLDDDVGIVMKKLRTWASTTTPSSSSPPTTATESSPADGGQTPFAQSKGTVMEAASARRR